jgi:thermitase
MIVRPSARVAAATLVFALALVLPLATKLTARADGGEFYYNAGRRVSIARSTTRLALRVPAGVSTETAKARAAALASALGARDVKSTGLVEVTVQDAKRTPDDLGRLARELGADVLPVFNEASDGPLDADKSTLLVTDEILVQFAPAVSRARVDSINATLGATIVEPLAYAPNGFKLRVIGNDLSRNALTVANAYFETGVCRFAHPNFLASRKLCFLPNDPQFAQHQWHLKNTGQANGTVGADVDAELAWDITQGSSSITVAIADTGIDFTHEDFNVTIDGLPKVRDPRDVVHADDDPSPQMTDADQSHGTAASGVAVAAINNGLDTASIAPKCRLMPIQLYAESTFTPNATEADAFTWAADHGADVMSNSWGPDNADTPLPDATRAAIDHATSTGRGGKGMVIFFAAGNDNFNTSRNNYANYSGVVAIAASTNRDLKASYSNFGAAISVAACSSGGSKSICTTDVTGNRGYSAGNFTTTFGGTSSASPLAAGVAALVLSVNPNLTWREVKQVLEQSAEKIDPGGGAYDANGHSDKYGYGRVNARNAVQLAVAGGPDTPALYDEATGSFFVRNSNTAGPANLTFGYGPAGAGFVALAGDWDGSGATFAANVRDTIGIYDPAAAAFFLKNSNGAGPADNVFVFGPAVPGDIVPLAGDWNGDGTDTIGIYVKSSGTFFLKNTNASGSADVAFVFGGGGSLLPLTGDWNGDGVDTIGLYDGATGAFFLRNSNTAGSADSTFVYGPGGGSFRALVGDWDNNGSDSVGIYDLATGAIFVKNTNAAGPADWSFVYGAGTVAALAANWDGV